MNKANYTEKVNFPLSTQGLEFIQEQILLAAEYAKAAGNGTYILSGCNDDGARVSDGIVIIDGELLAFKESTKSGKIGIVESYEDISAGTERYEKARLFRVAKFGTFVDGTKTYDWSDFKVLPTNKKLHEDLEEARKHVVPKGSIMMWSGKNPPAGWALCNGLNGTPDLRGRFIVGYGVKRRFMVNGTTNYSLTNPDLDFSPEWVWDLDNVPYWDENYTEPGNLSEEGDTPGNKGGEKAVALTKGQLPSHSHHSLIIDNGLSDNDNSGGYQHLPGFDDNIVSEIYRSSTANTASDPMPYGSGMTFEPDGGIPMEEISDAQPHENRPPYYVLAFIMKVI